MAHDHPACLTHARARLTVAIVIVLVAGLAAAGGISWYLLRRDHAPAAQAQPNAVPVTVATATARDVSIDRSGIGLVQASVTAAIHTQVDGKLISVDFAEGDEVHRGDVLAKIDPRLFQAALDQANAKKAEDEAQLDAAQKDLTRAVTLVAKNAETQQTVDRQTATVNQIKATIEADKAAIESAATQLDYATVRAPSDGRMGIRMVDPGNIVHASDTGPIAILAELHPIAVIFTLPQENLQEVRQAMARGPIPVIAYDQDDKQRLAEGRLLLVDNQIDQTTGTFKLKAMFPNDDDKLWPGQFVHARAQIATRTGVTTVPAAAVQRGATGLHVWLLGNDGTVQARPVRTADTVDGATVIESGVAAGDRVVTGGTFRLQNGARVEAQPVAGTAAAGGGGA